MGSEVFLQRVGHNEIDSKSNREGEPIPDEGFGQHRGQAANSCEHGQHHKGSRYRYPKPRDNQQHQGRQCMIPLDIHLRVFLGIGQAFPGGITLIDHPAIGKGRDENETGKQEQPEPVKARVGVDERSECLQGVISDNRIRRKQEADDRIDPNAADFHE